MPFGKEPCVGHDLAERRTLVKIKVYLISSIYFHAGTWLNHVSDLTDFFNEISQQVRICQVMRKLVLVIVHHRHRNDEVVKQNLIIRDEDSCQVRSTAESPVDDATIGQLLGMYPPNTLQFASGLLDHAKTAFEIWETKTRTLIYAEVWEKNLLSDQGTLEFIMLCTGKVESWNRAMELLGFDYRFEGDIQMKKRNVGWTTLSTTSTIVSTLAFAMFSSFDSILCMIIAIFLMRVVLKVPQLSS